jgi:hypothetical protein
MRRSGDIDKNSVRRVRCDERRIADAPQSEAQESRLILLGCRIHDAQIGDEGLRVERGARASKTAADGALRIVARGEKEDGLAA